MNLLAINLSALILFYVAGFKPLDAGQAEGVRVAVFSRIVIIIVGIALLSLVLGAVTWTTFQTQSFEAQAQDEIQREFDDADIDTVDLVSVTVDYEPADLLLGNEPEVSVLIGIPRTLEAPPDLAQQLDDRLTEQLGQDVYVRVGFVEEEVSEKEPADPPLGWTVSSDGTASELRYDPLRVS